MAYLSHRRENWSTRTLILAVAMNCLFVIGLDAEAASVARSLQVLARGWRRALRPGMRRRDDAHLPPSGTRHKYRPNSQSPPRGTLRTALPHLFRELLLQGSLHLSELFWG